MKEAKNKVIACIKSCNNYKQLGACNTMIRLLFTNYEVDDWEASWNEMYDLIETKIKGFNDEREFER